MVSHGTINNVLFNVYQLTGTSILCNNLLLHLLLCNLARASQRQQFVR
jgi:hypothetical protein